MRGRPGYDKTVFGYGLRISKEVEFLSTDSTRGPQVFAIGRALKGYVKEKTIFGSIISFDKRIGPANRAIGFFEFQCAAARKAVDTWCLIARRINSKVNRDIRKVIGMMIWEARELANYEEPHEEGVLLELSWSSSSSSKSSSSSDNSSEREAKRRRAEEDE